MMKNDNHAAIDKQFPMIDIIFWNLLQSEYYKDIPETTGTLETVKEDEETLLNTLKENGVTDKVYKKIDFDLSAVSTGAALYGEEKGFILGFIHGVKMATDISKAYDLLQLIPELSTQKQDE